MFKDNREFFYSCENYGLGIRITDEVDIKEIGSITRYACEHKAPAPLFENIKGYPGRRVLGNPVAHIRRLALALDIDPTLPYEELVEKVQNFMVNRIMKAERQIKPKEVDDAPCKENIVRGEINLYKIVPPVIIHGGDGAPKICTWHGVVTKDLRTSRMNLATYRGELISKNLLTFYWSAVQRIASTFREFEKKEEDMPAAIVLGPGPTEATVILTKTPAQLSKYEVIGGLLGEPLEVVKCETNDLLVPARSEIILEGKFLANKRLPEGPFGEYSGYRVAERDWRVVFKVECVTYRSDPWLTISNMGMPVDDCGVAWSLSLTATIRAKLDEAGIPYKAVYMPPECGELLIIVQAEPSYGIATRIAKVVFSIPPIESYSSTLIVVPPEYDIFNPWHILHAIASRCNPAEGKIIAFKSYSSSLLPYLSPEQRKAGGDQTDKIIFDCIWPMRWSHPEVPILATWKNELLYPKELQGKTEKIATKYNLDRECEVVR